ncbi:MAG TPA: DUF3829 domain-containing protein [Polyangiaceae bacterium]|nr:DUF3829 domain-containing protein [Polyangiaceae bacterium]
MNKLVRRFSWFASVGVVMALSSSALAKPSAKDEKVNTYVQLLNSWSNYVYDNSARYAKWVNDMNAGPTCKERGVAAPSAVGDSAPATYQGLRKALKKTPKLEADEPALQMVTALEELIKPVKEASDYYSRHKYLEDGCKRGVELHPSLVAGWTKYIKSDQLVRAFVEKYNDERQNAELNEVQKKYGKKLRYYHLKLPMAAKSLIAAVDGVRENGPDTTSVSKFLADFAQALTETQALVAEEKKGKNSNPLYEGGYEQFVKYASWYKEAVEAWLKAVDAEAKNAKANQGERERTRKRIIDSYNQFIEQANKTMFSKTMK